MSERLDTLLNMARDLDRDVSELQLKAAMFDALVNASGVSCFAKDLHSTILWVNDFGASLGNGTPGEMIGQDSEKFFPDAEKYLEDDRSVAFSGAAKVNYTERTPGGVIRSTKCPLYLDKSGKAAGVVVFSVMETTDGEHE